MSVSLEFFYLEFIEGAFELHFLLLIFEQIVLIEAKSYDRVKQIILIKNLK